MLKPGDVVFVEKKEGGDGYMLRQPPEVGGAMVAMDPHTGRVLAMVGGFSYSQSEFNRATQAYAAARLVVQADRLCGGARQRLHAGFGGDGRADHHQDRQRDLDAEEL